MKLGAVFLILPLVISLLKEGFTPVSNATATFAMKHITKGRKVYVGVNQLITADNPSLRITAILLIPITVILSISIPAIRIFPMGDLMNIISIITVIVAVSRGDIFRSVIISIPVVLLSLFSSTVCAEYYTAAAANIGYDMGAVTEALLRRSMEIRISAFGSLSFYRGIYGLSYSRPSWPRLCGLL